MSEVDGSDTATMPIVVKFFENCVRHLKFIQVESFYFDQQATVNIHRI